MVRLFYSNRTEELFDELSRRTREQQLRDGPLVPVQIVVPSANVAASVRMAIARSSGIAANLDVARLIGFASDLVAKTTGACVADASSLQAMALAILLDPEALSAPDLAPVRAYLHGAGDAAGPIDLRSVQLAARIGRLFEEYTYSRAELLLAWRRGPSLGEAGGDTEMWQRRMWLGMFGPGGLAERRASPAGRPVVPLCDAVAAFDPASAEAPRAVHVVAFAHFAQTFHALFDRLARFADVSIYALSPCEGFWEDADSQDPEPLLLWGRPGREQMRALNRMAGFDHDERFVDPLSTPGTAATLLHRLQSDVLRRESRAARSDQRPLAAGDESIVLLEHASVRRELEAVASEIWRLCAQDDRLRFDDVALLVPDVDEAEYAAQVGAVFREAHDIPHRMLASGAGVDRVFEAIDLLLALPLGRFTRQDLLRIAVHPLVVATVDDGDPERWIAWCDALGVVHGADRTDHEGTYIAGDILNWDQGLRRLALGSFMAGDPTGDRRPFEVDGQSYVPYEILPSDMDDAAAFGLLVQSLLADARFARDAELTLAHWADFLGAAIESYVVPTSAVEEERLAMCLRRVHEVGRTDIGGRRVRYRIACEIVRERIRPVVGSQPGEGVVVSTLSAMRSLPFRVVFACGMGEGRFPSPEAEDPLDLRWARRREGDVTARERDRYAFLEMVIGIRDRLVLSYVSRDAVTGDGLAPSSVVQDLLHTIERDYGVDTAALRRRHPLRRWDPAYFPDLFSESPRRDSRLGTMQLDEARAEAQALALRRSAESCGAQASLEQVSSRASEDRDWAALADHLRLSVLPPGAPAVEPRVVIPLYAILKFLEFPLQGWARFRLGLDELEDDDVMGREDEPFETPGRDETVFLRSVLLEAAATGRPLDCVYDAEVRHRELRGSGPSGVFARGERADHIATLDGWTREIAASGFAYGAIEVHRFGRAGEHARADHVHQALRLDVEVVDAAGIARLVRAEIGGRTLPLGPQRDSCLLLARRMKDEGKTNEWTRAERDRLALRAFVDHAILSASGLGETARASVVVLALPDGTTAVDRVAFAPISRAEATGWLRGLVRQLITGSHAYFFPCEAVLARAASREPQGLVTPWIERARDRLGDDDRAALRSASGPVPRVDRYDAPDEDRAQEMVASRFGLPLDRWGTDP